MDFQSLFVTIIQVYISNHGSIAGYQKDKIRKIFNFVRNLSKILGEPDLLISKVRCHITQKSLYFI